MNFFLGSKCGLKYNTCGTRIAQYYYDCHTRFSSSSVKCVTQVKFQVLCTCTSYALPILPTYP